MANRAQYLKERAALLREYGITGKEQTRAKNWNEYRLDAYIAEKIKGKAELEARNAERMANRVYEHSHGKTYKQVDQITHTFERAKSYQAHTVYQGLMTGTDITKELERQIKGASQVEGVHVIIEYRDKDGGRSFAQTNVFDPTKPHLLLQDLQQLLASPYIGASSAQIYSIDLVVDGSTQ